MVACQVLTKQPIIGARCSVLDCIGRGCWEMIQHSHNLLGFHEEVAHVKTPDPNSTVVILCVASLRAECARDEGLQASRATTPWFLPAKVQLMPFLVQMAFSYNTV